MKNRVIGGIGFVVMFYLSLFFNVTFNMLLLFFLFFSIQELTKIYKLTNQKIKLIIYSLLFIGLLISLYALNIINKPYLIYISIVIMLNDVFAFLVGCKYGKHKLSKLSPKKTIEGSLGGLLLAPIGAIFVMELVVLIFKNVSISFVNFDFATLVNYNPFANIITLIIISAIYAMLGQIGDLVESYFKRSANIKDSGTIIYGHGGILDRLDSWVFVMPIAVLLLLI